MKKYLIIGILLFLNSVSARAETQDEKLKDCSDRYNRCARRALNSSKPELRMKVCADFFKKCYKDATGTVIGE